MALSMHTASVPAFRRTLQAMLGWLDKAEAHAQARRFDAGNYLGLRLAPDMLPLVRQFQIATDGVKGCLARLSGTEPPKWDDTEATLDEVRARLRSALDYVASFDAARIDGSEGREIVLPMRSGEPLRYTGEDYLKQFVLPNFYFHATVAYAILRSAGVELGKRDFLGG